MQDKFLLGINHPVIKNHKAYEYSLLPGLAYIDMIYQLFRENGYDYTTLVLRNLSIFIPLIVEPDYDVLLNILCSEVDKNKWQIRIEGQEQRNGILSKNIRTYITAEMHKCEPTTFEEILNIEYIRQSSKKITNLNVVYDKCRTRRLVHTGFMKADGDIYEDEKNMFIDISIGREAALSADGFMFHPILIDGSTIGSGVLFDPADVNNKNLFLPIYYESFYATELFQKHCITRICNASRKYTKELNSLTMEFFSESGKKIGELKNYTGKLVREGGLIVPQEKCAESNRNGKVESNNDMQCQDLDMTSKTQAKSAVIFLRNLIAEKMGKSPKQISVNIGYYEMGLNSLLLLEIVKKINVELSISLAPTMLFEYTTILELSNYLINTYPDKFNVAEADKKTCVQEDIKGKVKETNYSVSEKTEISDDIAIIGMAGRYPKAKNLKDFWENLKEGRDCISEIPQSRWDPSRMDGIKSPSGKRMSKWGGFIDDPEYFDPKFFRISPREAETMDPQERLFLQTCWEAIEDAGYTSKTLVAPKGKNKRHHVGVFVGVMHKDYTMLQTEASEKGETSPLSLSYALIANRVSYFCNFHGPSMAVDTVCSSSLIAVHLALESIKRGESEVALAGGVNLSLHPNKYMTYGLMDMHASDGYCHTFGKGGDGYVSGEGIGAVVLKPLKKAIEDGDHVYAVVKGSAINHVGTVSGVTVPSPVAQADVIEECLNKSGINPRTISYIEAHGTGTSLGDPIEIQGLVKAFGQFTSEKQFCSIGSVKSNIGHAESAAGISGLQKTVLQLYHKTLVPSLHSEEVNPYLDFKHSPFYIQHKTEKWKQPTIIENGKQIRCPLRAGISSFGAFGSNAHIILEEYIPDESGLNSTVYDDVNDGKVIIPLSAKTSECLTEYAKGLLSFLKETTSKSTLYSDAKKEYMEGLLQETIREILSEIIDVENSAVETDLDWNELGVEALHISELIKKIREKFQIDLNFKDVIQRKSICSVARYLLESHYSDLIQSMSEYDTKIDSKPPRYTLEEIAYTLQVGREPMEERVAFVAGEIPELIHKLGFFLEGKEEFYYHGNTRNNNENIEFSVENRDSCQFIKRCSEEGKIEEVAKLWIEGEQVDWSLLYGKSKPKRISLPTYPFAKTYCWIPDSNTTTNIRNALSLTTGDENKIHPLVHKNTSDFYVQRFSSLFTGEESFLADHVVNGQRILPGAAYLEMIYEAFRQSAGIEETNSIGTSIKNITWIRPLIVEDQPVETHIELIPEDNGEIFFEVLSDNNDYNTGLVVYSQGKVGLHNDYKTENLDINSFKEKCRKVISSSYCYELLRSIGLDYGTGHQGIQELYIGENQLVARVELPLAATEEFSSYKLHPGLMDSALQTTLFLASGKDKMKVFLPFELEELIVLNSCPSSMWVVTTLSGTYDEAAKVRKFNVDLCDNEGRVCIRIKGFSIRLISKDNAIYESSGVSDYLLMQPVWKEKLVQSNEAEMYFNKQIIVLCEPEGVNGIDIEECIQGARCIVLQSPSEEIAVRFKNYTIKLFEEIKNIKNQKDRGKVLFQIVTSHKEEKQLFSGLSGLLKTAQLENPRFIGQVIEIEAWEDTDRVITVLNENSKVHFNNRVRYAGNKRYILGWSEMKTIPEEKSNLWKDNGVYIISGGAGELGYIFAKEIAYSAKNATLILTGRSKLSEQKKFRLKALEITGNKIEYKQADITDRMAVINLVSDIEKEFHHINGIIHSAGIIKDNFIMKKSKHEIEEVMAPKINGLINLDIATKNIKLDFFVLFSSIAGSLGNIGQADYSTANAFMDVYSNYRNSMVRSKQRWGLTISINWPLWKEGGMNIDQASKKLMQQTLGIVPMNTAVGIEAFYQGLASEAEQMMVVEGTADIMRDKLLSNGTSVVTDSLQNKTSRIKETDDTDLLDKVQDNIIHAVSKILKIDIRNLDKNSELSEYGFDSITYTELTNHLNNEYKLELAPTIFFDYSTLNQVAEYLIEEYREKIVSINETPSTTDLPVSVSVKKQENIEKNKKSPLYHRHNLRFDEKMRMPVKQKNEYIQEPVAIVGMSGSFPMAKDLDEFWDNLLNSRDCISEMPENRWDWKEYKNDKEIKWGGFIDGIDEFDPFFFGISPKEAMMMDPQQRLLMTYVWKVIEDAGYSAESISGTNTAIFVGTMNSGYSQMLSKANVPVEGFSATGSVSSVGPNRMSYFLNIHGPSEPIETACSSSLVAIHRAVNAINNRDCDMAITGGVNTILNPELHLSFVKSGMLSEDGRCKTFSDKANGYVRGEGVGFILLKRLKDAEEAGDHIYGVIKATAENHGGHANSLTAPNPKAQAELLKTAYTKAGIDPRTVTYIEAHGTGTELGDPIEINGLKAAFKELEQSWGVNKVDTSYCGLGSVKTNVGHLELAAGIAGVIKVLLQLQNKMLVKSLHCDTVNQYIQLKDSPFYIVNEPREWKPLKDDTGREVPLRAGISSFGFGGVNAHIVIEEYIPRNTGKQYAEVDNDDPIIIVLSAKNQERLYEQVKQLLTIIKKRKYSDDDIVNIAYTLQIGRQAMEERLAVIVNSIEEMEEKLNDFIDGKNGIIGLYKGQVKQNKEMLSIFDADEELQEAVDKWIQRKKYTKLIELWVKGLNIEWKKLYGDVKPRRLSLMTYPFARGHYWIPKIATESKILKDDMHEATNQTSNKFQLKPLSDLWSDNLPTEVMSKTISLSDLTNNTDNLNSQQNQIQHSHTISLHHLPAVEPLQADLKKFIPVKTSVSCESLVDELTASLAEALYMDKNDIDIDKKFVDMGLDSIVGVEWIETIKKQYGISISVTRVYDYPNIREFAEFLKNELNIQDANNSEAVCSVCSDVIDDTLIKVCQGDLSIEQANKIIEENLFKEE